MEPSEKECGDALLAARIADVRQALGLSMRAFAKEVGVSHPTQSRIERAKRMPDALYLRRLRERFQVDLNALLLGEAAPALTPRAAALLQNWQAASDEGKAAIEGTAAFAAHEGGARGQVQRRRRA